MNAFLRYGIKQDETYLESLLDFLYERIAVRRKAVHGEYSAVSPAGVISQCDDHNGGTFQRKLDGQPEHFGGIASLNVITLALAGVTSDNGKVCACDGEDGAAIFGVWVETPLLRVCDSGHVGHGERK